MPRSEIAGSYDNTYGKTTAECLKEEEDIYIISKYFPTRYVLITRGKCSNFFFNSQ